jgi:hypothetical protein
MIPIFCEPRNAHSKEFSCFVRSQNGITVVWLGRRLRWRVCKIFPNFLAISSPPLGAIRNQARAILEEIEILAHTLPPHLCCTRSAIISSSTCSHSDRTQRLRPGPILTGRGNRPPLMPRYNVAGLIGLEPPKKRQVSSRSINAAGGFCIPPLHLLLSSPGMSVFAGLREMSRCEPMLLSLPVASERKLRQFGAALK